MLDHVGCRLIFLSVVGNVFSRFVGSQLYFLPFNRQNASRGGGGVLPYKGLTGTCGQPRYVFRDFCLKQGIDFINFCLKQGIFS